MTVTACFEQEDFTDDDVGKVVLSEINDGKPCEYTIHGCVLVFSFFFFPFYFSTKVVVFSSENV